MKIGILTFHRAINYGAFLQALALKTYLTSLGNEVEMVDYWPEGHADGYRLLPHSWKKRSFFGKVKFFIYFLLRYSRAKKRIEGMQHLVEKYFGLSVVPRYQTAESLKSLAYDCVIYGSDQIWWKSTIPGYSGFDPVYWGEYLPSSIKKIAYAPSMGIIDLTAQDKEQIKKWLCNFSALSVRETGLYEAIHELTEKQMPIVLDPVFLLSKEQWESLCHPVNKERYILYYNLIPSQEADELVKKLQKRWGYEIVEITGAVNPRKNGKRYVQTADAIEFISLIRNAEFVVTSSFHGTAFSIIFEKQFVAVGFGKKAGRVESLLRQLGIQHCLFQSFSELSFVPIDYNIVKNKMAKLLESSSSFIQNNI